MMNLLDRLVSYVSPASGLRRQRARLAMGTLARGYEGASRLDGWRPKRAGASANTEHRASAAELRYRARSLEENNPYIARGIAAKVANTVGSGVTPKSMAASERDRAALDAAWVQFVAECDADGRNNLYGLQTLCERTRSRDGEVLVRLRPRRTTDGLRVPLQLQVLEIDWLDSAKNETIGADTVINGIQYSPLGRVVGYWLYDQHPGELVTLRGRIAGSRFVPAASVLHYYRADRPGQGRASVIVRTRDLMVLEDAELARKNLETRLSVLVTGEPEDLAIDAGGSQAGAASTAARTGELGSLPSGTVMGLPPGGSITVVEPKAAPGFNEYLRTQLHAVAAGIGVTYEQLTGDMTGVNYSSARVALIEFRRNIEQHQWQCVVPRLCEPIWRAFVDACVLAGIVRSPDYAVDWSTPKWDYVDPEKEVRADLDEIFGGLASHEEKLRKRGYSFNQVNAQAAANLLAMEQSGWLQHMMAWKFGPTDPAATAAQAESRAQQVALQAQQHALAREIQRLQAEVSAAESRELARLQAEAAAADARGEAAAAAALRASMEALATCVREAPAPVVNVAHHQHSHTHATTPMRTVADRDPDTHLIRGTVQVPMTPDEVAQAQAALERAATQATQE